MEFKPQHELVRNLARNFAETEFTDEILEQVEETHQFPMEIVKKMGEAGFYGIKYPEELGGAGADHVSYVIVMEEISKVSGVASIYVSSPNSLAGAPILMSGTPEQKEKYLRPLATGEKIGCFALTEPGAGSDAAGVKTSAVLDGDHYVLNGRKTFITGAPIADYAIIYAKTDPHKGIKGISAFIVDLDTEGISFGKPEEKMGIIGCPTSDIVLENVRVPKEALLGQEGKGFINAMQTLDTGRIGIAAQSIGLAGAALDEAIAFAKSRKQFGKNIAQFQGVQFMLADMAAKLEAARQLTYEAARVKDAGDKDASKVVSMAKYFASETCNEIAAKAVQIHGGYGFIKDYKVERIYRDCRVTTIYEGTSQVQQMVIAGALLK